MGPYTICAKINPRKNFVISNAHQSELYTAKQQFSFIRNTTILSDTLGNRVAKITRRISLIVPAYKIEINNCPPLYIKRDLCFQVRYSIQGKSWDVVADSACETYLVRDADQNSIYKIRKAFHKQERTYILSVTSSEDPLTGMCIAIAIDKAMRAIRNA